MLNYMVDWAKMRRDAMQHVADVLRRLRGRGDASEAKATLAHAGVQLGGPQCGNVVPGTAALVGVATVDAGFKIDYTLQPGWTYQWRSIQRHIAQLREQYQGTGTGGNLQVEETVHALFLDLYHLYDWLHQDSALPSLDKITVKNWIDQHPASLSLCRDYANTRKHATRNQPGALLALITSIDGTANGYTVTISYRPWDQPAVAWTRVDALDLATRSEQDWRDLLTQHGIAILP